MSELENDGSDLKRHHLQDSAGEETFLDALREVVGANHVLVSADLRATYETDWSRRWSGSSLAVVRPSNTSEVSAVLSLCHQNGVPCVPQGGRTGLVGGSVPVDGEIVVSLERLTQVGDVDSDMGQLTVGAGVALAAVHNAAQSHGWEFGVDLASRDSATIGGMIATNAGGTRVVRHGQMREQVVGIEVVLADGSVLRGSGEVLKDNAGYDLAQLIIGSEGTLGIITSARLRLVRSSPFRVVALVGAETLAGGIELIGRLRRTSGFLSAAEFIDHDAMSVVCDYLNSSSPVAESPWYVLIECAGDEDPTAAMSASLGETDEVVDELVAVAIDAPSRNHLWSIRESMPDAIARVGIPHKLDVGLPHRLLDEFADKVRSSVRASFPDSTVVLFGHLGEGNIHVNVLGVSPDDDEIDNLVLRLVAEMGGNIASEHGIGRAKTQWLELARTPEEIRAMYALKAAFDPKKILNPGVILTQ